MTAAHAPQRVAGTLSVAYLTGDQAPTVLPALTVPAILAWDPSQPARVQLVLPGQEWTIPWGLLTAGLTGPAAAGRMFITPLPSVARVERHEIVVDIARHDADTARRQAVQLRSLQLWDFFHRVNPRRAATTTGVVR